VPWHGDCRLGASHVFPDIEGAIMQQPSIGRLVVLAGLALCGFAAQAQSGFKVLVGATGIGLSAEPGSTYASDAASGVRTQRQAGHSKQQNKPKRQSARQDRTREQQGPRNEAVERAQRSAAGKGADDGRGGTLDESGTSGRGPSPGAGAAGF
jgi:hypothetical protein